MSARLVSWTVVLLTLAVSEPARAEGPSRDEMMAAAAAFAEHVWTCGEENTRVPPECSISWSCDWQAGQQVTGLPYDWGGYKTIAQFDADIAAGLGAGSHSWHGILNCTTGLDCSGYVSRVWQCGRYTTSTFHRVSHPIEGEDMLPGDAYNEAGSHIVLWVGESDSGAPVFYEATAGSVNRVHLNERATWSVLEGFVAIRSDLFGEAPELRVGTPEAPIEIASFPFEDANDTRVAPSNQWDRYGCAPQREEGPEVIYRFTTTRPGSLRALVTDGVGVDVDLHLLEEPDPETCVARHDTEILVEALPPGTWYLAADTWTNAAGTSFPGPYDLLVEFSPDDPPGPDLIATPDTAGGPQDAGAITPELAGLDLAAPAETLTAPETTAPREDGQAPRPGADARSAVDTAQSAVLPPANRQPTRNKSEGCSAAPRAEPSGPWGLLPMLLFGAALAATRGVRRKIGIRGRHGREERRDGRPVPLVRAGR